MKVSWQIVRFNLKEIFSISYGNYSYRDALIITLTQNGFSGYGECTAIDYYQINLQEYYKKLHLIKQQLEKQKNLLPIHFYTYLETLNLPSFLRSALDCAYWDLFGKLENKSFLELNNMQINNLPESSITISVAPIDLQIEKIQKSKWNNFKVKCNGFDKDFIEKLATLNKNIALDSNGSFTKQDCEFLENNFVSSKFSYIEQPMKTNNFQSLNCNKFANWMADEDCKNVSELIILQPHYKSVNVKLLKSGGLTPSLALIIEAKKLNFKIMIGCMTESTIGISAASVLAPLVDYVDLDGANLIANDIANGTKIVNGKINLSEKPGLGISIL